MDLHGKSVIVTASASGIGEAVARRLSALGAGVVINSVSSVEAGQKLVAELKDALYVQGDISLPATASRLVEAALDRWSHLDGLVNNAGTTVAVPLGNLALRISAGCDGGE